MKNNQKSKIRTDNKIKQRKHTAPHDLWHQDGTPIDADNVKNDLFFSYLNNSDASIKPKSAENPKRKMNHDSLLFNKKTVRTSLILNFVLLSVVAFLSVILLSNHTKKTKIAAHANALLAEIDACETSKKQVAGELAGCVSDVNGLTSQLSLAAKTAYQEPSPKLNRRLQKALKQKVMVQRELDELYVSFFEQFQDIRTYQDLRRKTWRSLKKDAKDRQKLIIHLDQATAKYEMVLTAAAANQSREISAPDTKLLKRNQERALYAEKILVSPQTKNRDERTNNQK